MTTTHVSTSSSEQPAVWDTAVVDDLIQRALAEDLGAFPGGEDITADACISPEGKAKARFLAKADGVLAGLAVAERVFSTVDPSIGVTWTKTDSERVYKGECFGDVVGPSRSIIIAERLALNILQRMSGIATQTRQMVDAVAAVGASSRILDTRKTAPLLRHLDKMAVVLGGGLNHRFGLYDMVMIKDNHVTAAGGIQAAVQAVYEYLVRTRGKDGWKDVRVEVETRTLKEVEEALRVMNTPVSNPDEDEEQETMPDLLPIHRLMLDNMVKVDEATGAVDTSMLRQAVQLIDSRVETEASGNVTLDTVAIIAKDTNVDFISSGALTHSVTALDISLKITQIL